MGLVERFPGYWGSHHYPLSGQYYSGPSLHKSPAKQATMEGKCTVLAQPPNHILATAKWLYGHSTLYQQIFSKYGIAGVCEEYLLG